MIGAESSAAPLDLTTAAPPRSSATAPAPSCSRRAPARSGRSSCAAPASTRRPIDAHDERLIRMEGHTTFVAPSRPVRRDPRGVRPAGVSRRHRPVRLPPGQRPHPRARSRAARARPTRVADASAAGNTSAASHPAHAGRGARTGACTRASGCSRAVGAGFTYGAAVIDWGACARTGPAPRAARWSPAPRAGSAPLSPPRWPPTAGRSAVNYRSDAEGAQRVAAAIEPRRRPRRPDRRRRRRRRGRRRVRRAEEALCGPCSCSSTTPACAPTASPSSSTTTTGTRSLDTNLSAAFRLTRRALER